MGVFCLQDEELVNHLLIIRAIAKAIWNAILSWFGVPWVLLKDIALHFRLWLYDFHLQSGKT